MVLNSHGWPVALGTGAVVIGLAGASAAGGAPILAPLPVAGSMEAPGCQPAGLAVAECVGSAESGRTVLLDSWGAAEASEWAPPPHQDLPGRSGDSEAILQEPSLIALSGLGMMLVALRLRRRPATRR